MTGLAPIEDLNKKGRSLYEYLVRPVEAEISPGARLSIIPDKALHYVPFSALVDPATGKYLRQLYRLSGAPSASTLIESLNRERDRPAHGDEKILAVGNPSFSPEMFPDLPTLEDAEREAKGVAGLYDRDSILLKGRDATEPRVGSALKDCDVAHLAVHCLVQENSPWLAALVLSSNGANDSLPSAGGAAAPAAASPGSVRVALEFGGVLRQAPQQAPDGLLYLSELYSEKLPRTRLVVLSACQSALGQYYRGEGIVSLVRPFLTMGVPTVVASLWPIDSKATADLMIAFHRQRKLRGWKRSIA
jgi:CHAT domain-containing protein